MITYNSRTQGPHQVKGAPTIPEMNHVLEPFFEKCGYGPADEFEVTVWDSGRLFELNKPGIKIQKHEHHWVRLVLNYDNSNAVGLHVYHKLPGSNKSVPAVDLFNDLRKRNDGTFFFLAEYEKSKRRADRSATAKGLVSPDLDKGSAASGGEEVDPEGKGNEEAGEQDPPPNDADEAPSQQGNLLDPRNLHKGTIALVLKFGTDPATTFDLNSFGKTLVEEGVPVGTALPMVLRKTFLHQGLVSRVNPDQRPALYSLTAEALEYAEKTDHAWTYRKGTKKTAEAGVASKSVSEPDEPDYAAVVGELLKIGSSYSSLKTRFAAAEAELATLEGSGSYDAITAEIESKERQIRELEAAVALLHIEAQGQQQLITDCRARVEGLRAQVNNPKLAERLKLLAAVRAQLGQLDV